MTRSTARYGRDSQQLRLRLCIDSYDPIRNRCMTAISWRHSIEATAAQLMVESTKARENGERYAQMTAENGAASVVECKSEANQRCRV